MTFGNLPTAELERQWRDAINEADRISEAFYERLLSECRIQSRKQYRVARGRYAGRTILVTGIRPHLPSATDMRYSKRASGPRIDIFGRLNIISKSVTPTGDNFGRRIAVVTPDQLDDL